MSADIIIKAQNLSSTSGVKYLLQNINWQVARGEQWVVFGANGCGKTTLLSIIAGYKGYSAGNLEVFGEKYREDNILSLRQRIGWVSSSFFDKCFHNESVLDIVLSGKFATLGLDFAVENRDIIHAKELLVSLGLKDKIKSCFNTLSKGERQNVLIARAFMNKPEILILDEPSTGLDVMARAKFLQTLNSIANDEQVTMIYVTHYPEEILPIFDHCLLLKNGAIYKQGLTADLLTNQEMSAFFEQDVQVLHKDNGGYSFVVTDEKELLLH